MGKTRVPRNDTDLREASHHLLFEWTMFRRTFELLRDVASREDSAPGLRQALMESFGIHARSLDHFLYADLNTKPPHETDILAEDFVPDWKTRRPERKLRHQTLTRIHKSIAHLTYDRLTQAPGGDPWEFGPIVDAIEVAVEAFFDTVAPSRLRDDVREIVGPAKGIEVRINPGILVTSNVADTMTFEIAFNPKRKP